MSGVNRVVLECSVIVDTAFSSFASRRFDCTARGMRGELATCGCVALDETGGARIFERARLEPAFYGCYICYQRRLSWPLRGKQRTKWPLSEKLLHL